MDKIKFFSIATAPITNKMRQLLMLLMTAFAISCFAQGGDFSKYKEFLKSTDVEICQPTDFKQIESINSDLARLDINPGFKVPEYGVREPSIGFVYSEIFESDDKDAAILFPSFFGYVAKFDGIVEREIMAYHNDHHLDVRPYLTVVAQDDMSEYSNADTLLIYEFDILGKPYMGKYTHVVGLYFRKYAHPSLAPKIILSDNGLNKKDEYIRILLESIRYGDEVAEEGVESEKRFPGELIILRGSPRRTESMPSQYRQ